MNCGRPRFSAPLLLGLAGAIACSGVGCGSGSGSGTTVQMEPEEQKKVDNYLKNYQKQMFDQHKKGAQKKAQ
ncbi:hypothetical protein EP7_000963 [Isosphaeraceae bacterium EP7]